MKKYYLILLLFVSYTNIYSQAFDPATQFYHIIDQVSSDRLKVDDDNNSSEELIYTIVELPIKGSLTFDGNIINIGDQFSQKDVDENKLVYNAISENYETYFSFKAGKSL